MSKTPSQEQPAEPAPKAITPSDTKPLATPGRITVTQAGSLSIVAVGDADNCTITYSDAPKDFSPPYVVRLVRATGTTAKTAFVTGGNV